MGVRVNFRRMREQGKRSESSLFRGKAGKVVVSVMILRMMSRFEIEI
jgi:hypothetical protein